MSSHQLNSAFTAAKYRDAVRRGPSPLGPSPLTPCAIHSRRCSTSRPIRSRSNRPDHHRLVRAVLRDRPGRRVPAPRPARAARRRGPRHRRQRDHHRRDRGPYRRPAVPRHRPVGAVRRTIRSSHPAAVLGRSACTAGSSPGRSRRGGTPADTTSRSRAGPTSSRPPCSSCRRSAAGATTSTRSCTAPRRRCRGASRSTAPIASRTLRLRDLPEATTRFHPLFLYESISGAARRRFLVWLGYRLRSRLRPGDLLLVFFIWYGTTRFAARDSCAPITGRSSASRRRRSCRWRSSRSAWAA